MKLSDLGKFLVGAATLWPILYLGYFFLTCFSAFTRGSAPSGDFQLLLALHLLTMACMAGLMVFYIVFLFKTDRVPEDKKALWAIVLFMGSFIAMPVFFCLYVWPEPTEESE